MNMGKYILPILMLAIISGCATNPIASDLRRRAQPITMAQVTADPTDTRGLVIWGGRIVNTFNSTNGGSIYIMYLPLDDNGKPMTHEPTTGRFVAISRNFLDPEAFPHGRLITVAGDIAGVRVQRLQNMQYTYPIVSIRQTHVWPTMPGENTYYYNYYTPPEWMNQSEWRDYLNLTHPNY